MPVLELIIDGDNAPVVRELSAEEIAARPPEPRRQLPKSLVWSRLVGLGKAAEAKALLDQDAVAWGRWFSPDWPSVFADDQGLLDFLGEGGLGLTAEQIAAVTA